MAPRVVCEGKCKGGTWAKRKTPHVRQKSLTDVRCQLASCVGYASRQLWRRNDLEEIDEIVLDLLCEALQRIGHSYRPKEGMPVQQAIQQAPSHIQDLVKSLERVASPNTKEASLAKVSHFSADATPYAPTSTDVNTFYSEIMSAYPYTGEANAVAHAYEAQEWRSGGAEKDAAEDEQTHKKADAHKEDEVGKGAEDEVQVEEDGLVVAEDDEEVKAENGASVECTQCLTTECYISMQKHARH